MISVEVLKKKILDKAIRGELVESNPSEKAVDIEAIKDNVPFEIPSNWRWCYLKQVSSINIGKTPPTKERKYWGTGIKWISIYDMKHRGIIKETKKEITFEALNDIYINKLIAPGTLIMSFKLTIGKLSILEDSCVHNEAIANFDVYEQKIEKHYLMNVLDALNLEETTKNAVKGKTLNKKTLNLIKLPLPPLEEQKRIGAKIEELFKLIDKKEKNDATLNSYKEKLKDKILDEAIRGKLVEQDLNDVPANKVIRKIMKKKEELIETKQLRREKGIKFSGSKPQLPNGWEWVRLGDLGIYRKGPFGSSLTKSMFIPDSEDAIKVYEQKNAINKNYMLGEYFISSEKFNKMRSFEVSPGDIIVSCAGTIGETYVMPSDARKGIINQALMKISLFDNNYRDFYLIYFDYILKKDIRDKGKGTAIINIPPFNILKNIYISFPPLEEQKRIVNKVEELFKLIDIIQC